MKIAIIGTRYAGLPTGVGFAHLGHDVVCVDKDVEKNRNVKSRSSNSILPVQRKFSWIYADRLSYFMEKIEKDERTPSAIIEELFNKYSQANDKIHAYEQHPRKICYQNNNIVQHCKERRQKICGDT